MATTQPTITTINDTFTTLVTNTNTVSLDLGATGDLNTNQDSCAVASINELELGIRGTSNNLVATDLADFTANNIVSALHELDSDLHGSGGGNAKADLTTNANDIVAAINEIEAVFDASTHEISAGTNQFDVTTGNLNFAVTGAVSIDASGDISLDADSGDVFFKDAGTTYGSLTNTSGNLIIKSGTSTMLTGSGTNATFNNNLTVENDLQVDGQTNLNGHVNLGNATGDNISVVGRVDTNIVPSTDGTRDLGSASLEWKDAFFDGTVTTDALVSVTADLGNFDITTDTITNPNNTILDIGGNLEVNVDDGVVTLKDGTATFGSLNNTSGNLIVKSGTTTALTFSGANVTTGGTVQTGGNLTMGGATISRTGALTLDVSTDITLDAGNGVVNLKKAGTLYGSLVDSAEDLVIKSGSTTAATFDGANVTFSGTITGGTLNTAASDVVDAINEHETDIGNMTLTGLSATNISAALRELRTELGTHGSLDTTTKTSAVVAINELHTTIGKVIDSDGLSGNLANNNIGLGLYRLDSAVGNLDGLDATDVPAAGHNNLVSAINEVAARVTGLDTAGAEVDSRIGSLSNLHAAFTGSEDNSIVNAINALRGDIPLIFNENGVQLN